jgi:hypothetical protein
MNDRRYTSIVWLIRSVWLSVYGWKDVLIRGHTPRMPRNCFHSVEVNQESRSEIISVGMPWNLQISRVKIFTKCSAVFCSFLSGMKWAIFMNLSMMTYSWSQSSDKGRSVMKSMAIDVHGAYGSSNGERKPYGLWHDVLSFWHSKQLMMYSIISWSILGHQKFHLISSIVLS